MRIVDSFPGDVPPDGADVGYALKAQYSDNIKPVHNSSPIHYTHNNNKDAAEFTNKVESGLCNTYGGGSDMLSLFDTPEYQNVSYDNNLGSIHPATAVDILPHGIA